MPLETDMTGMKYSVKPEWVGVPVNYSDREDTSSVEPNFLDPACVLVEEDEPLETNEDDEDEGPPRSKLRRLLENKVS